MESVEQRDDEIARVNALKEYDILDTPSEEDYDGLTKLASEICQVQIAAITFLDENREWFKSQVGGEMEVKSLQKNASLCAALLNPNTNDILVIPNCSKDPRVSDNPVVKGEPNIKFYAAAPLITHEGYIIGSLCLLDKNEKQLSAYQLHALKVLANQIMKLLELKKTSSILLKRQDKLQDRYKELEQFSYAVSHDLRGPVKNISALIGLLSMQLKLGKPEDAEIYMSKIVKESNRMSELVADLLEFSLVGKNTQKKEWIHVNEVLEGVKLSMEQKLKENDVELIYSGEVNEIFAVKSDITRLLQNLLENAVKFKKKDVSPVIRVDCRENSGYWEISVEDNGIGMAMSDTEKIFEIFSRLHTSDQYQGTGIGLAVCKRIAENHDGRIWVESAQNVGSTFHVSLKKQQ